MANKKKVLIRYLSVPTDLNDKIEFERQDKKLTKNKLINYILKKHYEAKNTD